jgi:hypothetical protein
MNICLIELTITSTIAKSADIFGIVNDTVEFSQILLVHLLHFLDA